MRIGEVARRTGVSVETLRAWERRYDVLDPERTDGGHRLYGEADVQQVLRMQQLIDDGWSAGAAAREITREPVASPARQPLLIDDPVGGLRARLNAAFSDFDAAAADMALDDTFARFDVPAALDEVILPVVRHLGDGWQDDPGVIAREHFASNTIRPRLMRVMRLSFGRADRVVLAAAPEREEHDIGTLAAAVVAAHAGWTVHFLGYRTPTEAIVRAADTAKPDILLIGAVRRPAAERVLDELPDDLDPAIVFGGAGFQAGDVNGSPNRWVHAGPISELPATLSAALDV